MTANGRHNQVSGKLGKAFKSAIGGAAVLARGEDLRASPPQRGAGHPGPAPVAAMLGRAGALDAGHRQPGQVPLIRAPDICHAK